MFVRTKAKSDKPQAVASTPKKAVRKMCIQCVGSAHEIRRCKGDRLLTNDKECPLFPYREGKRRPSVKVIRKFCLQCMRGSHNLVRDCPSHDCPLWPYRFGTNPNRAGIGGFSRGEKPGVE